MGSSSPKRDENFKKMKPPASLDGKRLEITISIHFKLAGIGVPGYYLSRL